MSADDGGLPEVVPPQSAKPFWQHWISGKEVAIAEGKETWPRDGGMEAIQPYEQAFGNPSQLERSTQDRKWYRSIPAVVCGVVSIVVILGIALGVGLGVGLRTNGSSQRKVTQSVSTIPFSTKGAFQLSGLSVCSGYSINSAWPGNVANNYSSVLLFFQHYTGDIRWMLNVSPGKWLGGTASDVIASDAKNGTPISVRCAQPASSTGAHLFYVNTDGLVRQRIIDNLTFTWSDGPFNDLNLKAWDADHVGLRASFYDGPIYNTDIDSSGTDSYSGVKLWVATSSTTFMEYSWRPGISQWTQDRTWNDMNGAASPASFGWGTGNTAYVMFIDQYNVANMYWFDTSPSIKSTPTHPLNVWTQVSAIDIPNLDPTAGLDFNTIFVGRLAGSDTMSGWNTTFAAENSTIVSTTLSTVSGPPAIANTRLAATSRSDYDASVVWVFYQSQGDGITMCTGVGESGAWNSTSVPIPNA